MEVGAEGRRQPGAAGGEEEVGGRAAVWWGAMKPVVIDVFCGLGGWSAGFLAEGYECYGFDIERHDYGSGGYPGQLVLQDALTIHGSQFRDAACIVASPPCQGSAVYVAGLRNGRHQAGRQNVLLQVPRPQGRLGTDRNDPV